MKRTETTERRIISDLGHKIDLFCAEYAKLEGSLVRIQVRALNYALENAYICHVYGVNLKKKDIENAYINEICEQMYSYAEGCKSRGLVFSAEAVYAFVECVKGLFIYQYFNRK